MTGHRVSTRSLARWLITATVVIAVILAVAQPWYAHLSSSADYKGLGKASDGFRLEFETGEPASPARVRAMVTLQILLVIGALVILVGSRRSSRRSWQFAGASAALAIAIGMSIYVLASETALWRAGLTWACVAAGALVLLAGTNLMPAASRTRPATDDR